MNIADQFKRNVIELVRFLTYDTRSVAGLTIIITLVLLSVFADYVSSPNPGKLYPTFLPPSSGHIMGTDYVGRDLFALIIHGIKVALIFGIGSALVALIVGVMLGAIAGYYGGLVDELLSRIFEVFLMIPRLLLVILVAALFGTNMPTLVICIGLTIWPANAKIMRAQVLTIKNREYVKAAELTGAGDLRIIMRHVLPNAIQAVVANTALLVGSSILTEAYLSFLGMGDVNNPSWGQIIHYAPFYLFAWWMSLFPGIFIVITVFAFNLLGDGLSVTLNPKLRR